MDNLIKHRFNRVLFLLSAFVLSIGLVTTPVFMTDVFAQEAIAETDTISISDARTQDEEAVVTVEGIVTVDSAAVSNGSQFTTYIQDETGGINIFAHQKSSLPTVKKGDRIKVTGALETYKGLKEIIPTDIEVIQSDEALPEPKQITLEDLQTPETAEQYEGQLVEVLGHVRQIPDSPAGGGYNISFVDEDFNGTTVRVMENALDVSELEEDTWYRLTAIVGRYDSYQLIPTEASDFVVADEQPELGSPEGTYEAVIGSVTDGDTLVLENPVIGTTRVRLLNMDTAETYPPRSNDYKRREIGENQVYHGEVATEYMQELISVGDTVTLKVGEEGTDAYGRLLAEVIREDGLNLNLEMVKKGHAVTYFIAPIDEEVYPIYQEAVKEAQEAGLGIWNPENPLLELPFEFRVKDDGKTFNKVVGHSDTKTYVNPNDWADVPVDKRIFFWDAAEAEAFGYTKDDGSITDPKEPEKPGEPDPEEPEEPEKPQEPGDRVVLIPDNEYGPAKLETSDLDSLADHVNLVVDITNNRQKTLTLTREQVILLQEKDAWLTVIHRDEEIVYEMTDVRPSYFRVSFYGQGNNQGGNQGGQQNGNQGNNNGGNQGGQQNGNQGNNNGGNQGGQQNGNQGNNQGNQNGNDNGGNNQSNKYNNKQNSNN